MNDKEPLIESSHLNRQSKLYRYSTVTLVVAFYIAMGFLLHPDANAYLLLGMPITILFQMLVARRPLSELWLRHGQSLQFDRWTAAWLILFLIGPIQTILNGVKQGSWQILIYGLMAILGALGAALAFRVLDHEILKQIGLMVILIIPIFLIRLFIQQSTDNNQVLALGERVLKGIQSLLFYMPAVFVAEEVFFRGALDSYLYRGETGADWTSAAFVSVLWGLWHMPIISPLSGIVILELVGAQLFMGLILSWLWRQSGNLAIPGTVHAIIDAVRNMLLV